MSLEFKVFALAGFCALFLGGTINVIFGLPHESDRDLEELLAFFERYHDVIHWVFFLPFEYIPHSEIGRRPERYNLRLNPDGGVDEIDGLTWPERCERGAESLQRTRRILQERYLAGHAVDRAQ